MTINEFIEELGKLRESWPWEILNGSIRYYAVDGIYQAYCPITAVCFSKLLIDYNVSGTREAGRDLGLHQFDRVSIVNAADNTSEYEGNYLRVRMLQALGLEKISK